MEAYALYAILIIANVWDFKTFKIPNVLTIPAMIVGIALSFYLQGFQGVWYSFLSILFVFITFLLPWLVFGMGAGDVKLLMVVSSFLGFGLTIEIGFIAILVASCLFFFLIPPKRSLQLIKELFYLIFYKIPLSFEKNGRKIHFSLPILVASLILFHPFI